MNLHSRRWKWLADYSLWESVTSLSFRILSKKKKNGGLMVQGMSTVKTYPWLLLCKNLIIVYWSLYHYKLWYFQQLLKPRKVRLLWEMTRIHFPYYEIIITICVTICKRGGSRGERDLPYYRQSFESCRWRLVLWQPSILVSILILKSFRIKPYSF